MSAEKSKLLLGAKWIGVALVCAGMASCASTSNTTTAKKNKPKSKEYFAESEYGVKASPRVVAEGQPVPKGGGRYMVGNPYEVKGKVYVPKEDPNYNKTGLASWYGSAFHGRYTANGEVYDSEHISAAHPTFPLPSYARVTNVDTGSSVIVRVNDRGPFHPGRIIDVSDKTAELLDFKRTGTARVNVQYVGKADMSGHDMPFLMASYVRKGSRMPGIYPDGQIATGVMVASNQSLGDQLQSYDRSNAISSAAYGKSSGKGQKTETRNPAPQPVVQAALAPAPTARPASLPAARPAAQPVVAAVQARPNIAPVTAPVVNKPVHVASAPQPKAVAPKPSQARPVAAQAAVTTSETAYAAPAKRRTEPQVIFGNVILRDDGMMQQVDGAPQGKPARR
ncbi:septal ring lytic transglycosylase RlpA family protein [Rhizobium helianthi]|uniref:Endolytic peptidoglycan transglycosylase RlpA n=1 Tax=Rhizobium helianthi TaxID=1132695 RepID=A0ABW4LZB4_9HYPH